MNHASASVRMALKEVAQPGQLRGGLTQILMHAYACNV